MYGWLDFHLRPEQKIDLVFCMLSMLDAKNFLEPELTGWDRSGAWMMAPHVYRRYEFTIEEVCVTQNSDTRAGGSTTQAKEGGIIGEPGGVQI